MKKTTGLFACDPE